MNHDARRSQSAGLLLFDIDGTLVYGGRNPSTCVVRALAAADEAGYVCAIASGRPWCLIEDVARRLPALRYAVCANGAQVVDLHAHVLIQSRPLSREAALTCHALLTPYRAGWNAFVGDGAYFEWRGASYLVTGRTSHARRAFASEGSRGPQRRPLPVRLARFCLRGARFCWRLATDPSRREVVSIQGVLERAAGEVYKVGCTFPDAKRAAHARALVQAQGLFEVATMGPTELEVTATGVTKATGAAWLMERLGVGAERAWAFGDGGNDLPLAEAVGTFVAMGNADAEVLAAANETCPAVEDDGVAQWLERRLLAT